LINFPDETNTMHFLFKDYTEQILKTFEEKRDANQLSQLLMHPTTANLRQEFLNVYRERVNKGEREEENTLRSFFGIPPAGKTFAYLIEKEYADRFRPIQSLIRRGIKNPSKVNVELVAWLIDFKPRPFLYAKKIFESGVERIETVEVIPDESTAKPDISIQETGETMDGNKTESTQTAEMDQHSVVIPGPPSQTPVLITQASNPESGTEKTGHPINRLKKYTILLLIIVILLGGTYIIQKQISSNKLPYSSMATGCMYWADDQFEIADCNEKKRGRMLFPLDQERMKNFKRITREDTITERSINVVYYISVNNIKEYYTMGGHHPVITTRNLRPLSRYIYIKYLAKKKTLADDSLPE
jgi:hypothetical protein